MEPTISTSRTLPSIAMCLSFLSREVAFCEAVANSTDVSCEQMGVGKTLMCLTLILATLEQPCLPPSTDIRTMTSKALRNFPSTSYAEIRDRIGHSHDDVRVVPSLRDLCADIASTYFPCAGRYGDLPDVLDRHVNRHRFYYEDVTVVIGGRTTRSTKQIIRTEPRKMTLCNTTLVVVPPILVRQWRDEVKKHFEDGALTVYVVGSKKKLPDIEVLQSHDVSVLLGLAYVSLSSLMSTVGNVFIS
jgi:hypothetical protein